MFLLLWICSSCVLSILYENYIQKQIIKGNLNNNEKGKQISFYYEWDHISRYVDSSLLQCNFVENDSESEISSKHILKSHELYVKVVIRGKIFSRIRFFLKTRVFLGLRYKSILYTNSPMMNFLWFIYENTAFKSFIPSRFHHSMTVNIFIYVFINALDKKGDFKLILRFFSF